ncbi:MAG: pitrilysin family protein [Anaerolineae bacterium]|nr:insulinase family protein [Anaerolineae bacterium]MDW8102871.1 pitrilysin family protein [Anaerolineae bacterium]
MLTPEKATLPQGIRLLVTPLPHTMAVSMVFLLGVGSRYESDPEGGISHFIEHLVFKGTSNWPTAKDIASSIEGVGGVINGSTSQEVTSYWIKLPKDHWKLGFQLLSDMLLNPLFREEDVEKERAVILEELRGMKDSPEDWVFVMATNLLWPGHPLGREIIGTKESLQNLSREKLLEFKSRHYVPAKAVISLAGAITFEEASEEAHRWLSTWVGDSSFTFTPAPPPSDSPAQAYESRRVEQTHVVLTWYGLPLTHPDRFALSVMNAVLGEGMSSRLFTEIREKRGLAYSISSYLEFFTDSGAVGIAAGVSPNRLDEALQAVVEQLSLLKTQEVTGKELTKAKEFVKGRLLLHLEDSLSLAFWYGRQELLLGHTMTPSEVIQAIDAVTPQDLKRVAEELVKASRMKLAIIGPYRKEKHWIKVVESLGS